MNRSILKGLIATAVLAAAGGAFAQTKQLKWAHVYETGEADGMKAPLRTLRTLGCEALVQTNAAGSMDPAMRLASFSKKRGRCSASSLRSKESSRMRSLASRSWRDRRPARAAAMRSRARRALQSVAPS